jgi:hypothetical protein
VAENHQVAAFPPEFCDRASVPRPKLLQEKQIQMPNALYLARHLPFVWHGEVAYEGE